MSFVHTLFKHIEAQVYLPKEINLIRPTKRPDIDFGFMSLKVPLTFVVVHFAVHIRAELKFLEVRTKKPMTCPSKVPVACSAYTSCQCIDSGNSYFFQCDGLWCNDQCTGCHKAGERNASKQATPVKSEEPMACPPIPPAACTAYMSNASCQCIDRGSSYFYHCEGVRRFVCDEQCSSCRPLGTLGELSGTNDSGQADRIQATRQMSDKNQSKQSEGLLQVENENDIVIKPMVGCGPLDLGCTCADKCCNFGAHLHNYPCDEHEGSCNINCCGALKKKDGSCI
jgi:hypothetical protein